MGTPRSPSPSPEFYGILRISKTACKAYKSLFTKFQPHYPNSHHNKSDSHDSDAFSISQESNFGEKSMAEDDPLARRGFRLHSMDDSSVFKRRSSFLSRSGSRRSHTPQARPTYLSSSSSSNLQSTTLFQRSTSRRDDESSSLRGLKSRPLSNSASRRVRDDAVSPIKGATSPFSSPRESDGFVSPIKGLSTPSSPPDMLNSNINSRRREKAEAKSLEKAARTIKRANHKGETSRYCKVCKNAVVGDLAISQH